ncbi:hypothetical protein C8R47DRAFT_1196018 [Mycena vitilis]|nr:hypothetical protein C8R47DRAFT_1196018 [Mycena vitilis]
MSRNQRKKKIDLIPRNGRRQQDESQAVLKAALYAGSPGNRQFVHRTASAQHQNGGREARNPNVLIGGGRKAMTFPAQCGAWSGYPHIGPVMLENERGEQFAGWVGGQESQDPESRREPRVARSPETMSWSRARRDSLIADLRDAQTLFVGRTRSSITRERQFVHRTASAQHQNGGREARNPNVLIGGGRKAMTFPAQCGAWSGYPKRRRRRRILTRIPR